MTRDQDDCQYQCMNEIKRITANIPRDRLQMAMEVTGKGITETLIQGLDRVCRGGAFEQAVALRGRLKLDVDLDQSRQRHDR